MGSGNSNNFMRQESQNIENGVLGLYNLSYYILLQRVLAPDGRLGAFKHISIFFRFCVCLKKEIFQPPLIICSAVPWLITIYHDYPLQTWDF